ncbi:facilitated trehalose transporter Tret1-like isoform X2 [Artemia franciscana]|uniref:Major facilitator superfamily (MFS) profile domain-containing protein n=1 Tax=Artemia franciscana TaxID=6661 RepID=A0AA88KU59_ARTSF|nr:hypothetical protein QYM36_018253 [Artemia franciscana]KAK2703227.1 hypothetical protein QYM36_018253 [Artemia franciscana]
MSWIGKIMSWQISRESEDTSNLVDSENLGCLESQDYVIESNSVVMKEKKISDITLSQASWIGSLMPMLALPGGFVGGSMIEKIGRKATIEFSAVPFATAGLLIALAPRIEMIYLGRMLQGFSIGALSVAIAIYLAETTHNSVRGTLAMLPAVFGCLGILLCYALGTFIGWRPLSAVSSLLGFVFFIFAHFLPQSPHWLITKGRRDEAYEVLTSLRRQRFNVHEEIMSIEISTTVDRTSCNYGSLIEPRNVKSLGICILLMLFQQLCGINAVIFYSASIFKDAGSTLDENVSSIIIGVVNLVSSTLAAVFIDRVGRRPLLITSCLIMSLSLLSLGGYFYLKENDPVNMARVGWIPLLLLMIIVGSFALGLGPVPWLLMSEIFSSDVRASASAVAVAVNWSCVFAVTKVFPTLVAKFGSYLMFWSFAVVCSFGCFIIVLIVPETKGKTLEEIQNELNTDLSGTDSRDVTASQTVNESSSNGHINQVIVSECDNLSLESD